MELVRKGGNESLIWSANDWVEIDQTSDKDELITGALKGGGMNAKTISEKTGIPLRTVYRRLQRLVPSGEVRTDGNVYFLPYD